MTDITKDLEKIILRAGIDGALTEEAVAQFHALIKERDALQIENKKLGERNTELDERVTSLAEQYNERQTRLQGWATREQELKDREEKCLRLELEAEYNLKRVEDHKSMVSLVFRNTVLKKQVVTPGSATIDQYGTRNSEFPDTTPVEEENT